MELNDTWPFAVAFLLSARCVPSPPMSCRVAFLVLAATPRSADKPPSVYPFISRWSLGSLPRSGCYGECRGVRGQVLCFHGSRPRARVFRGGLAGSRRSRRARAELLTHAKETAPRTRLEAARDLLVSPRPCQRSSSRLFIRSLIFKQQLKLVVSASD